MKSLLARLIWPLPAWVHEFVAALSGQIPTLVKDKDRPRVTVYTWQPDTRVRP